MKNDSPCLAVVGTDVSCVRPIFGLGSLKTYRASDRVLTFQTISSSDAPVATAIPCACYSTGCSKTAVGPSVEGWSDSHRIAAIVSLLGETAASGGAAVSLARHRGNATIKIQTNKTTRSIANAMARSASTEPVPNQLVDCTCVQLDPFDRLANFGDVEHAKPIDRTGAVVSRLSNGFGWACFLTSPKSKRYLDRQPAFNVDDTPSPAPTFSSTSRSSGATCPSAIAISAR